MVLRLGLLQIVFSVRWLPAKERPRREPLRVPPVDPDRLIEQHRQQLLKAVGQWPRF